MSRVNENVFVRKEEPLKNRKETLGLVIDTIKLLEHNERIKDIKNRKQKNIRVLKIILKDCKSDLRRLQELLPEVAEIEPKVEEKEEEVMRLEMKRKGTAPSVSKLELEIQKIRDKLDKLNV